MTACDPLTCRLIRHPFSNQPIILAVTAEVELLLGWVAVGDRLPKTLKQDAATIHVGGV
jgi:hypothetical protein